MAQRRNVNCSCCGRHRDEAGEMSRSGICRDCGHRLLHENIDGIHARSGPAHLRRLRGIAKYLDRERVALGRPTT